MPSATRPSPDLLSSFSTQFSSPPILNKNHKHAGTPYTLTTAVGSQFEASFEGIDGSVSLLTSYSSTPSPSLTFCITSSPCTITFPISIKDLTSTSSLLIKEEGPTSDSKGSITVPLFDSLVLKTGLFTLDPSTSTFTKPLNLWSYSSAYTSSFLPPPPPTPPNPSTNWLKKLTVDRLSKLDTKKSKGTLYIPVTGCPTVYSEEHTGGQGGEWTSCTPQMVSEMRSRMSSCLKIRSKLEADDNLKGWKPSVGKNVGNLRYYVSSNNMTKSDKGLSMSVRSSLISLHNRTLRLCETVQMCDVLDTKLSSAFENKHRMLEVRDRTIVDVEMRPGEGERGRLKEIVERPGGRMEEEEREMLWKFRFSLVDSSAALPKFLLCVNWEIPQEVTQTIELLQQWKDRSTITITDAVKLLGSEPNYRKDIVRRFAVGVLDNVSDSSLGTFLLQLVMGIKYEVPNEDILADFLITRARSNIDIANYLFWYLRVEAEGERETGEGEIYGKAMERLKEELKKEFIGGKTSPKAGKRTSIGDGGVSDSSVFKGIISTMKDALKESLGEHPVSDVGQNTEQPTTALDLLTEQESFFLGIMTEQIRARDAKGKKASKESALKTHLQKYSTVPGRIGILPVPLSPSTSVIGVLGEKCFMFKSALYPAVVTFRCKLEESEIEKEVERRREDAEKRTSLNNRKLAKLLGEAEDDVVNPSSKNPSSPAHMTVASLPPSSASKHVRHLGDEYSVIFKSGDDLRQDQLIIVMIRLFDSLLKSEGLDLSLTPYSILATSPTTGLVEFVAGSSPVSAVLSENPNGITGYLAKNNPSPENPNKPVSSVVETYIKSCAGYCVITYILGIGDRHLDNIMLKPTGHFFHIDFGFVFGRDPKPMPPAFRLTQSMVDGFGGDEGFKQFKSVCCQTFNLLRRHAGLVVNLLHLSKEGNIPDLSNHPTLGSDEIIQRVEEKFRLDLTDEQAEHFFISLIGESMTALAPRVLEVFHQIAVARR
ncbi:hypothetical protein TrST_g10777 [Triparma strigata]|uniref:phosphatidylinositol 3-kinase n=1 Tax=Triparma strigata TaxID=1606541 RepID=A0A9W7C4W9_9STRA|nr:hypothetical protein TrST_g10777 [Triparma strigata]